MSDGEQLRATLIVPANAAAARLVRLIAGAIATDIALEGDALDDVRLVAGELADSLVRTGEGDIVVRFEINGRSELVVSGDTLPTSNRPVLVDAEVLQHAEIVGAKTDTGRGHFEVAASGGPAESSGPSDGNPADRA
jgi:hypothetical protein